MSNNVQQNILDVNEDDKSGCMDVLSVGGMGFSDVTLFVDVSFSGQCSSFQNASGRENRLQIVDFKK